MFYTCFLILFQSYKTELNGYHAFSRSCNVVGNTHPRTCGCGQWGNNKCGCSRGGNCSNDPTPHFNPCYNYVESVNPIFDPRRVLLRRTFFINEDCSKYLSVGYYAARDYQPLLEVGASTKMPVRLTEEHVRTFAEHLPRICEAMCSDEQYSCVDVEFKLQTTGTYHVARVYLGKSTSACISQNCVIWCTFFMWFKSTNIVFACFILCYNLCTRCPAFDSLCRTGKQCR